MVYVYGREDFFVDLLPIYVSLYFVQVLPFSFIDIVSAPLNNK